MLLNQYNYPQNCSNSPHVEEMQQPLLPVHCLFLVGRGGRRCGSSGSAQGHATACCQRDIPHPQDIIWEMTPCSLHRQREIIISPGHSPQLGQPNHGPRWPSLDVPGQPASMLVGPPSPGPAPGSSSACNQPYFTLVYI